VVLPTQGLYTSYHLHRNSGPTYPWVLHFIPPPQKQWSNLPRGYTLYTTSTETVVLPAQGLTTYTSYHLHRTSGSDLYCGYTLQPPPQKQQVFPAWIIHFIPPPQNQWFLPAQGYTLHTTTTEPVVFACPVLYISHHPYRASGSYLPWVIHCALPQQNQWFLPAQLSEKSAKFVSVFKGAV
jgi:hypothetical protein